MYLIFLFGKCSNHVINILCVFPVVVLCFILYYLYYFFSNNCLLSLPISGLQGFISRHVGLFLKFSLWSLRVIKGSLSAVVKRVKPFAPSNNVCGLCLQEKLSILSSAPSLNKRGEIFVHCIQRKKFLLRNLSMSTDEVPHCGPKLRVLTRTISDKYF